MELEYALKIYNSDSRNWYSSILIPNLKFCSKSRLSKMHTKSLYREHKIHNVITSFTSDMTELSVFIFYTFELMRVREAHNVLNITAAFVLFVWEVFVMQINPQLFLFLPLSACLQLSIAHFFLSTLWRAITSNSLSRVCTKKLGKFSWYECSIEMFPLRQYL